jgi:PAS domain S-box-containing protein
MKNLFLRNFNSFQNTILGIHIAAGTLLFVLIFWVTDNPDGKFFHGHVLIFFFTYLLYVSVISLLFYLINKKFYSKLQAEKTNRSETINRYETLIRSGSDVIWDFDLVTKQVFYSENIHSIFGYSEPELKNNSNWWEQNLHPKDRSRELEKIKQHLEMNHSSWNDEYRFCCKNGEYKTIFDRSFIVRNTDQKPVRMVGAMMDLTEIRSLEKQSWQQQIMDKNSTGKRIIASHENDLQLIREDLQEDVNQMLASIKMHLIQTNRNPPNINISTSIDYLDRAMEKIKAISDQISSTTFEYFGMVEAIQSLLHIFSERQQLPIEFIHDSFAENNLEKPVQLLVFRFIEECMLKLIRYANPKNIRIELHSLGVTSQLLIHFYSEENNILHIFNEKTESDSILKLELYDGVILVEEMPGHHYLIKLVV